MIVIGQSHVRALLDGYEILARAHEAEQEAVRTAFVVNRPERTVLSTWQGEGFVKDTSNNGLPEVVATWDPTRVVLAWGGNQMNLRDSWRPIGHSTCSLHRRIRPQRPTRQWS